MMEHIEHVPVLRDEVTAQFDFPHESLIVDGTLGLGGHTEALLQRHPQLSVIGVEWDSESLQAAQERLAPFGLRFRGVDGNYVDLPAILSRLNVTNVSGVLVDLGMSSRQLDDGTRGFSFNQHGPLDMRMSKALPLTAWDVINQTDELELARMFKTYGEERFALPIAKTLKSALERGQLSNDAWAVAQCIRASLPAARGRIDPATRCFQALRIVVNHELDNLQVFLDNLPQILAPGGRAIVLAFHSLEDRLVKHYFQQAAKGCVCPPRIPQCVCGQKPWAILKTRKAIQASAREIVANPRSRSVRMRVLEKL